MDKVIEIMLDPKGYKQKPGRGDAEAIRQRLTRTTVTDGELIEAIRNGQTWMPAAMEGGTKRENFHSQQVLALDFDNDDAILDPVEAWQRAYDMDLEPFCLYFTFSATLDRPRYRMVWILDQPIYDAEKIRDYYSGLLELFPEADKACKDVARMFYGGGGEVWSQRSSASKG